MDLVGAEHRPEHGRRHTADVDGDALDSPQRGMDADGQRVEVTPNAALTGAEGRSPKASG